MPTATVRARRRRARAASPAAAPRHQPGRDETRAGAGVDVAGRVGRARARGLGATRPTSAGEARPAPVELRIARGTKEPAGPARAPCGSHGSPAAQRPENEGPRELQRSGRARRAVGERGTGGRIRRHRTPSERRLDVGQEQPVGQPDQPVRPSDQARPAPTRPGRTGSKAITFVSFWGVEASGWVVRPHRATRLLDAAESRSSAGASSPRRSTGSWSAQAAAGDALPGLRQQGGAGRRGAGPSGPGSGGLGRTPSRTPPTIAPGCWRSSTRWRRSSRALRRPVVRVPRDRRGVRRPAGRAGRGGRAGVLSTHRVSTDLAEPVVGATASARGSPEH